MGTKKHANYMNPYFQGKSLVKDALSYSFLYSRDGCYFSWLPTEVH